jgi:hypothetical protein
MGLVAILAWLWWRTLPEPAMASAVIDRSGDLPPAE